VAGRVGGEDGSAYRFDNLGYDGVSEGLQTMNAIFDAMSCARDVGLSCPGQSTAVQFGGKPCNHSTQVGFRGAPTVWQSWTWPLPFLVPPFASTVFGVGQSATLVGRSSSHAALHALGVGQRASFAIETSDGRFTPVRPAAPPWFDPYCVADGAGNEPSSLSPVRRSDMDSTHHGRLAGVAERFQVREDPVSAASSQSRDVLNDDEKGSQLADETGVFPPEPGALAIDAGALAGVADVLAREPAADDVNGNSICRESIGRERADIVITGDIRPVLREHTTAERIDFAERYGLEAAGALEAEREAADSAEDVQNTEGSGHAASPAEKSGRSSAAWLRRSPRIERAL